MLPRTKFCFAVLLGALILVSSACRIERVTKTIDGDTIRTASATVRLQGVDTPESGERCFAEAKFITAAVIGAGGGNALITSSGTKDRYGREIAFVGANGQDIGEVLLRFGVAKARYDSRDGYAKHAKEALYHQIDDDTARMKCSTPTTTSSSGGSGTTSDPKYLKNCTAAWAAGRAPVYRGDPGYRSGLDGDSDGIGCEKDPR